jgi:hypothetical protein
VTRGSNPIRRRCAGVRRGISLGIIAVATTVATGAPCQETDVDDRALAESLFRAGRALIREERYGEACEKLEQSQRLVRAAGTLLNLAVCHEKEGKLSTAWFEYQESVGIAIRMKRPDREAIARERMAAIEPLIPHIRIDVPADARVEGLVILRGETEIPNASWGLPLMVDPGTQNLRATAPGHEPWSIELHSEAGKDETVTIPRLSRTPALEAVSPAPETPARPAEAKRTQVGSSSSAAPEQDGSGSGLRTVGWMSGGAGLALLATGGYYGVRALQKRSDSDAYCSSTGCYKEGVELNNEARELAVRSNVLLIAGAVLVGTGAVVLAIVPSGPNTPADRAPRVGVAVAPTGINASFSLGW